MVAQPWQVGTTAISGEVPVRAAATGPNSAAA